MLSKIVNYFRKFFPKKLFKYDYIKMKNNFVREVFSYVSIVSPDGSYFLIYNNEDEDFLCSSIIKEGIDNDSLSLFNYLKNIEKEKAMFAMIRLFRDESKRMKYNFAFDFKNYKRCKYIEKIYGDEEKEIDQKIEDQTIDEKMDL